MTARIAGFVTRAAAGLKPPSSFSRQITPEKGGVAVHYGGPKQTAAEPGSDHSRCVATWRSWQNYHMNTHGWVDIAYTGGFCQHGFAFAGRGEKVRTAANGTNHGNQNFYAIVFIGGEGQEPTQLALDAADWWLRTLRDSGAGTAVQPHSYFKSTGCPGTPLRKYAKARHKSAIPSSSGPGLRPGEVSHDRSFVTADQVRGRVAKIRLNAELPRDPASDNIWVDRIVNKRTHHMGQARAEIYEKGFATYRKGLDLEADKESDKVWVQRVVIDRTHTFEDAKKAIAKKASSK